jgi:hypothetical protein
MNRTTSTTITRRKKKRTRRKNQKIRKFPCWIKRTEQLSFFVDLLLRLFFFPPLCLVRTILARFFSLLRRMMVVVGKSRIDSPLHTYAFLRVGVWVTKNIKLIKRKEEKLIWSIGMFIVVYYFAKILHT